MDLALFDIDGTLVDTGGAGRRAIDRAAARLHGKPNFFDGILFDGMTDRAIVRAALHQLERAWGEDDIDRMIESYLEYLAEEVAASKSYLIYPGVEVLLEALVARGRVLGLGTGNVEAGARIKLERGGLNRHFGFGGFGDDHEDRAALIRAGLARGERILGRKAADPWIIGDTPRDLTAARAAGARCVLVATGRYGVGELSKLGAELCVATLEDPRVLAVLGS